MTDEQRQALLNLRIIWGFLLLGQAAMGAVLLWLMFTASGSATSPATGAGWVFGLVPTIMLLTLTPIGYFIRNQFYKAKWQGDAVAPAGYVTGNIVLLAMLEGTGITGLVLMFVSDQPLWPGLVAGLAMALQAINFPTGEPMRPHRPEFAQSTD